MKLREILDYADADVSVMDKIAPMIIIKRPYVGCKFLSEEMLNSEVRRIDAEVNYNRIRVWLKIGKTDEA